MPRKKKAILIEDDQADDLLDDAALDRELKDQQAIEEWLGDFQSRFTDQPVKVLVEKFEDGEWAICRKYPLAGFDHETVRDEFGGGKYRATLFGPNGKYIKEGRNNFKFAEGLPSKKTETPPQNPLENPLMVMLLKSQEEASKNMMALTQAMITAQAGKSSGGGLPELIEAMVKMQTLTPKPEKPFDNFKETLGMMKLVKEVTGDGDEKSGSIMSDIKEFLEMAPLLKDAIPTLRASLPAGTRPELAAGSKTSIAAQPSNGGETPVADPVVQKITGLVPRFLMAAKANAPIEEWSDNLLDALEDEVMPVLLPQMQKDYGPLVKTADDAYDILIRLATDAESRNKIYIAIPYLAPHRAWCDEVINKAIATLTNPENGVTVNVSPNVGDTNGHTESTAS